MQLPISIEYAIHGLVYLAQGKESVTLLSEVARATKVPESYMRKVFQQLAREGIVVSQRGSRGGYRLGRAASVITLRDVVEAIDGKRSVYNCMGRERRCSIAHDCPVKGVFESAMEKMYGMLAGTTVADVLGELLGRRPGVRWLSMTTAQ